MTTGVFAKHTRLSHKALRLYDAMGLLAPAFVDEQNGYRYYSQGQVDQAKLISLLRQLEMPLSQIAEVLALRGKQRTKAITHYWQEVEKDIRAKRKLVHFLERYLEGKGETMFEVKTRNVAEQKVVTIERHVYAPDLPKFISDAMSELYSYLAESGQQAEDTSFVAYHGEVNVDSDGPAETCVPFTGNLEPKGDMRIRIEPAHKEAYVRLSKAQVVFPDILEAYDAVSKYLKETGKTQNGSCREVYFADWSEIRNDEPLVSAK
jgi:DNA-binding transcriptional MerR regulator